MLIIYLENLLTISQANPQKQLNETQQPHPSIFFADLSMFLVASFQLDEQENTFTLSLKYDQEILICWAMVEMYFELYQAFEEEKLFVLLHRHLCKLPARKRQKDIYICHVSWAARIY